jgi:hypothetical protein
MKLVNLVFAVALGLLILFSVEGAITLGSIFNFEQYSVMTWIFQILAVIATITLSIKINHEESNN